MIPILFQRAGSGAGTLLGTETQGLAIDFTDLSMVIRDTGTPANAFSGNPNNKLTYSSPSTKWILGSNGLYSSGTTLRTSYDASANALGVLIEEARTNLFLRSNDFSNASWVKDSGTISADAAVSPSGATDADAAIPNSGAVSHAVHQDAVATGAVACAITIFLKIGSLGLPWCEIATVSGTVKRSWVNLSTGAVGTMNHTSMTVTAMPNATGWYKIVVIYTAGAATTDVYFSCRPSNGGSGPITGDGTSPAFYMWGAQLEVGAFATSPIVTAGATVTRVADAITLATSLMPFSASLLSMFVKGQQLTSSASGGDNVIWAFDSGGGTALRANVDRFSANWAYRDSLVQVDTGKSTNNTSQYKIATTSQVSDVALVLNGGAAYTNAGAAAVGSATSFRVGSRSSNPGVSYMNGYIAQIMYLPRRMSNAELQTVTT